MRTRSRLSTISPPPLTPTLGAMARAVAGRKLGVVFRRQVRVGKYIADFAGPGVGLIVEVDGEWHEARRRADESQNFTEFLRAHAIVNKAPILR